MSKGSGKNDLRDDLDLTLDELAERRRGERGRTLGGPASEAGQGADGKDAAGPAGSGASRVGPGLPKVKSAEAMHPLFWPIVGLHLLVVLLNALPLYHYFSRSWQLEHYRFFPLAFAVIGYIIYERIEWGQIRYSRWTPLVCGFFLLVGFTCFAISAAEYNHYLPTVGTIFVLGSLLNCLQDKTNGRSLLPTWFLLLALIRVPLNFDTTLIAKLQLFSARFASGLLDFLSIPNFTPGAVIQVIEQGTETGVKSFDVERACSGVQSLYTLFFCTLTVAVYSRRSFIAGLLLIASGVFWSVTMNGIRIVTCVAVYFWFDVDIYSGIPHEILGYAILLISIGLIASTDAFIQFLVSPVQVPSESRNPIAYLWNLLVAGAYQYRHEHHMAQLSDSARRMILSSVIVGSAIVCLSAGWLLVTSAAGNKIQGIYEVGELGLTLDDIPQRIEGEQLSVNLQGEPVHQAWNLVEESLKHEERNINSTYGPYSTSWVYDAQPVDDLVQVSLDYIFLGWHELKICYLIQGWNVERAILPDDNWSAVELYLSKPTGEKGFCIFSVFDYQGTPMIPFSDNLSYTWLKLKMKISRELSTTTTFQIQCLIQGFDEIPKERIAATRELHLKLREQVRDLVLEKIKD